MGLKDQINPKVNSTRVVMAVVTVPRVIVIPGSHDTVTMVGGDVIYDTRSAVTMDNGPMNRTVYNHTTPSMMRFSVSEGSQ